MLTLNNQYIRKYKLVLKFGVVGVLNTLVDLVVFTLLNILGVHYSISQVAGYSCGTLNSFVLNKFWTFKANSNKKKNSQEVIQFITVNIFSLMITILGLKLLINNFNINVYIAKICVIILAQAVNFFSYKLWVFKK